MSLFFPRPLKGARRTSRPHAVRIVAVLASSFLVAGTATVAAAAQPARTTSTLAAVTGLTTQVTSTSITFTWSTPKATTIAGVVVRRGITTVPPASPTGGILAATINAPAHSATVGGLKPDTLYAFSLFNFDRTHRYSAPTQIKIATNHAAVAPAFTSAAHAAFTVGVHGSIAITATGFPSPTITESGPLPQGLSFSSSTGVLSGTPARGTGGTSSVTFLASNGTVPGASQNFTITINQAAAITSLATTTFVANSPMSFNITATGFPAPTFAITNAPTGFTLDPHSGILHAIAASSEVGTHVVTITASNGIGAPASQSFTIVVAPSSTCTTTWTGADGSSNWADPANWNSGTVPSASDWACIPQGAPGLPVQVNETATAAAIADDGGLLVTGILTLSGNQPSTAAGGLTVIGTLAITGAPEISGSIVMNNGTLKGPGTLTIATGSTLTVTSSGGSAPRLYSGLRLVNDGTVTVTAGTQFNLFPGEVFENAGTLSLGNGASLMTDYGNWGDTVPSVADNLVNDQSGTISIPASASVKFTTKVFEAGTISNGGSLDLGSVSQLSGTPQVTGNGTLSVSGLLQIPAGVTAAIANALSGTGVVDLQGTTGFGNLAISGGASISKLTLEIGDSGYSPNCAASVTALSGSQVTGSWVAIATTGTPVAGGTWQPTVTATTAGATLAC